VDNYRLSDGLDVCSRLLYKGDMSTATISKQSNSDWYVGGERKVWINKVQTGGYFVTYINFYGERETLQWFRFFKDAKKCALDTAND
jgi:hypothetical protein